MVCGQCGRGNPDGSKFCQYCGAAVRQDAGGTIGQDINNGPEPADGGILKSIWADMYIGQGSAILSEGTGGLSLYPDKLVFTMRFGNVFKGNFGFFSNGQQAVYPIDRITECHFEKRLKFQACIAITMDTGENVLFVGNCTPATVNAYIAAINEKIGRSPDDAEEDNHYAFEMRVTDVAATKQGSAAMGNVQKGSLNVGMSVCIIGENGVQKGVYQVKGIAVNKAARPEVSEGTKGVALLLSACPAGLISSGDTVCVKST